MYQIAMLTSAILYKLKPPSMNGVLLGEASVPQQDPDPCQLTTPKDLPLTNRDHLHSLNTI